MSPDNSEPLMQKRGGHPTRSTRKKINQNNLALIAATNQIALEYQNEKEAKKEVNKKTSKVRLTKLIIEVIEEVNLPSHFTFAENTIR